MLYHRRVPLRIVSLLIVVALACAAARAQEPAQSRTLVGVVVDQNGAPVRGALVMTWARSVDMNGAKTDADGRFEVTVVPSYDFVLMVSAEGFEGYRRGWAAGGWDGREVRVVLAPLALAERVTVTAARTETRLSETAASVVVL
ncbi:MAG TPA: carboxypeptidase-like regulatory domain-containing protein, partial [Pyrinomonadaceae bacterium]|nr:carboxypeptidase-like regulatory domain-containing protein [Pyrinomonadaceae bacterium]